MNKIIFSDVCQNFDCRNTLLLDFDIYYLIFFKCVVRAELATIFKQLHNVNEKYGTH